MNEPTIEFQETKEIQLTFPVIIRKDDCVYFYTKTGANCKRITDNPTRGYYGIFTFHDIKVYNTQDKDERDLKMRIYHLRINSLYERAIAEESETRSSFKIVSEEDYLSLYEKIIKINEDHSDIEIEDSFEEPESGNNDRRLIERSIQINRIQ
jgi:hypothetical protein